MLSCLVAAIVLAQQPAAAPDARLAAILEDARARHRLPAVAAWVSRRGDPVAVAAVGLRRADGDDPVVLEDRFHLGSVTKSLNAALIATLVDDGTLAWDTTLENLFPDWPVHRGLRRVTLAQLLSHTSGLAGFRGSGEFAAAPTLYGEATARRGQLVRWLISSKPAGTPGAFVYSNAGITVAAAAAERATGEPWEALMRRRVFEPLGMTRAGFGWPGRVDIREPWGHYLRGATRMPHDPRGPYEVEPALAPAVDVHLSITDLGRFLADQARGLAGRPGLLRPETYRRLHALTGAPPMGWMVSRTREGRRVSSHGGSAETFYAIISIGHEDGIEVAVMTNENNPVAAAEIVAAIWQRFREAAPPKAGG